MQRGIRDAVWDDAQMLRTYHHLVAVDIGGPEGVVIFDESGFPKKGDHAVGVARPSCGVRGNVVNCQVGVFAAYASRHGDALADKRLFMPEPWLTAAYARRRTPVRCPTTQDCRPSPHEPRRCRESFATRGGLSFTYVRADCLSGQSPACLDVVAEESRAIACVSIPADPRCWLRGPVMETRPSTSKGQRRTQSVRTGTAKEPIAAET
jgi:SRSO17 transposase